MNGRLYRSRDERVIAGVAGGLADYFAVDPSLVRVLWVLLAIFSGGAFVIVYLVMAFVVPEEPWVPDAGSPTWTSAPATGPSTPEGESAAAQASAPTEGGTPAPGAPMAPPTGPWRSPWEERHAQREAWRAQRRAERAARRAAGQDGGQTGAIVFGLILVAVGVAFLLPLVFPGFAIGRYWPVLLIGLGAVLLIAALRPGGPRQP